MAVELAQAYVSITPSARGIGRSLSRELTGPLDAAGTTAGDTAASSFGRRFTPALARIGKAAGLALGGGIAAAGFFGVKVAADFQQTQIAFEGILGSADKANRLLGDLRDFAAKTPFEFTGLTDSAKQLLAVGFATEDIIPTMTTLGNVAATLGVGEAEIKGVVRALGQMRGKGKASAEELQQISEQIPGFSAIGAIAEDMGIRTSEAFEELAKGAIPADDAIEAILNGMEDFPGAAGAMDRQSKTLNGVLSTFKDTLAGIAIDFITPHLPAISRAVESFSGTLSGFFGGLQTGFTEGSTGAEAFGGRVHDAFVVVRDFIRDEVIPRVTEIATVAFAAVKTWWDDNGETLKETVSDVFGSISGFASAIASVVKEELLPRFGEFATWLFDNGPGMEIAIAGIAAAMAAYAANAVLAAGATLIATWPFIAFAAIVGGAAWATQELVDKFDLLQKATEGLQWFTDNVLVPMMNAIRTIKEGLEDLIDLIPKLPKIPGASGGLDLTPGFDLPGVPYLDGGGVMPGRRGIHYPAMVAGGETVLPTHKAELSSFMGGSALVGGNLVVQQLPGEDAGEAALRGLRKVRLMAAA